jgi:hypothetical protein
MHYANILLYYGYILSVKMVIDTIKAQEVSKKKNETG